MPARAGWVQLSIAGQRATQSFNPLGERQDFLGVSQFVTGSAYLTGAYGVVEGLEVWGQLPVHRLRADGSAGTSGATGLGDVRAAIRIGGELVGVRVPFALRAGIKIPGSDFPVDPRVLPLTEGQRDLEVSLESGWSGSDVPVYLVGWVGYRWRGPNRDAGFEPGDEWFGHLAVGGTAGRVHLELGVDVLRGLTPVEQGLRLDNSRRRLVQLLPTVGTDLGGGRLEITSPIAVSGRNLPAPVGLGIGYRLTWGYW